MGYDRINWTPAKLAKAIDFRKHGIGYRAIAKYFGVSHGAVRYKLNPHHRELCLQSAAKQWRIKHPDAAPAPKQTVSA